MKQELEQYLVIMDKLKQLGGNCLVELETFKGIENTGKPIGRLTIDELLSIDKKVKENARFTCRKHINEIDKCQIGSQKI